MPDRIRLMALIANGAVAAVFSLMALIVLISGHVAMAVMLLIVAATATFSLYVIHKAARVISELGSNIAQLEQRLVGLEQANPALPGAKNVPPRRQGRHISSGSKFEEEIGYSRAVAVGDDIWVSGTTGYDYSTMTIQPDVVAQCDQTFRNIAAALEQAGASLDDVVRVLFIVPDPKDWQPCWPVIKKYLGKARPASTLIHTALMSPEMKIEIEVTARRGSAA